MKRVVFEAEALADLEAIKAYVRERASVRTADRFVSTIIDQCEGLTAFPYSGVQRDDLRPGIRTISLRRRVLVAYEIDTDEVFILSVLYGGRNIHQLRSKER